MAFNFHLIQTLQNPEDSIVALAFSTDHQYLGSASKNGSKDGVIRIYDVEAQFRTICLIMGTVKGELLTFSPKTRKHYAKPSIIHIFSSPIDSIEFNDPRNEMLICTGDNIIVMKKEGGKWRPRFERSKTFCDYISTSWTLLRGATAIAPDCTALMVTSSTKGLDRYILSLGSWKKETQTSLECAELPIMSSTHLPVIFIDKGHAAVVGTANGYAVICDSENRGRIQTLHHSSSDSLAYNEESLSMATGDVDSNINIWVLGFPESKRI
ncbi:hypothetical protein EV359DRAFT_68030 [Lentinula novae-zelandiae]|nr:hypothetical protein EV359DRAFT_68030 [Lentinula novae-zelandiae]